MELHSSLMVLLWALTELHILGSITLLTFRKDSTGSWSPNRSKGISKENFLLLGFVILPLDHSPPQFCGQFVREENFNFERREGGIFGGSKALKKYSFSHKTISVKAALSHIVLPPCT